MVAWGDLADTRAFCAFRRRRGTTLAAALALLALTGCRQSPPASLSPNAKPEILAALREDLTLERHASDGGGTVEMTAGPQQVPAGGSGSWRFVYRAGPLGIAEGGWLFFQVSPFWNWSTPQVTYEQAPGYATVSSPADGLQLAAETVDRQLLGIRVGGRALAPGEEIHLAYSHANVDNFAEDRSPFWFAVDGDGDGIRKLLPEPVTVDITAGPAARLIPILPSIVRPGEATPLKISAVDAIGNATVLGPTQLELSWRRLDAPEEQPADGLPAVAELGPREATLRINFAAPAAGSWQLEITTAAGLLGWSNPMVVSPTAERILWGDLHGHSNLSDGTGTPEQYFRYARDVAGLDFVALTDHDHWGLRALSRHPPMWDEIRQQVAAFNAPGNFITLLGYEWTSWLHGHRHVLYFADDGPLLSSVDPRYETPAQLWAALRGRPAMTFAHHSAGEPIATNWDYPPDPELEPITEIVSIHGSSEAADSPAVVRGAISGQFVRDVLERGYQLGFIGSGDGHDGHPGLAALANPSGGLAAVRSSELTRDAIRRALGERHSYATNGVRMVLEVSLDETPMGSRLSPSAHPQLRVAITGSNPLERLDIVQRGLPVTTIELDGRRQASIERQLAPTADGDYIYVRVFEQGGGTAWSSPFFVVESIR